MKNLKNKVALLVLIIGSVLIYIFYRGIYPKNNDSLIKPAKITPNTSEQKGDEPRVVETKPVNLDGNIVAPNQTIELTFNMPLENVPEFKHKFDPELEHKTELSADRKTVKITPVKGFVPGTYYSLTILRDTKFNIYPGKAETKKVTQQEMMFKFKTVDYKGV